MSGLSRAVTWTQRVGYSYPPQYFQAAVKERFPALTETEVIHCVHSHEVATAAWNKRIWQHDPPDLSPEAQL